MGMAVTHMLDVQCERDAKHTAKILQMCFAMWTGSNVKYSSLGREVE
jgi:hypothetical protein